jgi:ABC-type glycerol-3-phosphate transport system substrate-binding protein
MKHRYSFIISILFITLVITLSGSGLAAPPLITFWSLRQCDMDYWHGLQASIEKGLNIRLNAISVQPNTFIERFKAAIADGTAPDIIEWSFENNRILSNDPEKSLVLPLEKYTRKSKVFKHVIPGRVSYLTYGKHIYGLPYEASPVVLIYNDTLWNEAGVDMSAIETWDEFFTATQKLSPPQKDGKPLHYAIPQNNGFGGTMFMIWQQSGAHILDKDGKPRFTSPDFIAFVEKWMEWYKTGTMCEWDWGNFGSLLKIGTMAAFPAPDWWVSQVNDGAAAGVQFRARPLPLYQKGGSPTASWGGIFLAIPKTAKKPEFLYKIIEYMQYNDQFRKTMYRDIGMLPSLDTVYDDPTFQNPNPKFGGQKLGVLQAEMARQIPSIQCGDIFWDAIKDFNEVYPDMVSGKISVAEGLQKVQDVAMKRYEESVTPRSKKSK